MLIENNRGGYAFLKGIAPYSCGVAALAGFEIIHARLFPALPLEAGLRAARAHVERKGRPVQALCGLELRSPRPFTFPGFAEFNASYIETLQNWDMLVDGLNPVARTNVAPAFAAESTPSVYGFSYTEPSADAAPTFVIAGAGELPEGSLDPADVVRHGETSLGALRDKAGFVLSLMEARLRELSVGWEQSTAVDIYTVHNVYALLDDPILPHVGAAALGGLTWHYARPPIETIEYEMDVRGCRREIVFSESGC
ncbi:MAG: hypothetical protein LLG20_27785 [Acidobacteriales bacterium]|nr:hypothetical protein [Terriglobales bacterium]